MVINKGKITAMRNYIVLVYQEFVSGVTLANGVSLRYGLP